MTDEPLLESAAAGKSSQFLPNFRFDVSGHGGMWSTSNYLDLIVNALHPFEVAENKKPTWLNTRTAFDHVGLLFNEPPGKAELLFV